MVKTVLIVYSAKDSKVISSLTDKQVTVDEFIELSSGYLSVDRN